MSDPQRAVAPLDRSAGLQLSLHLGPVWWGATWAYLCGVAAGVGAGWPAGRVAAITAGWFVVVPLAGLAWRALLAPDSLALGRGTEGRDVPGWAGVVPGTWRPRIAVGWHAVRSASLAVWEVAFGAVAALAGAALVGSLAAGAIAVGLALAIGGRLLRGPAPVGWRRSLLEIGIPAWVGWCAAAGPVRIPGPFAATHGVAAAAGEWLAANWVVPLVVAGFVVVHHGATAVARREDLAARHRELVIGFLLAIAALALADRGLASAAVALGFALSWPFQSVFRRGRVRWHLEAAQPLLMGAMLAGLAGTG